MCATDEDSAPMSDLDFRTHGDENADDDDTEDVNDDDEDDDEDADDDGGDVIEEACFLCLLGAGTQDADAGCV